MKAVQNYRMKYCLLHFCEVERAELDRLWRKEQNQSCGKVKTIATIRFPRQSAILKLKFDH